VHPFNGLFCVWIYEILSLKCRLCFKLKGLNLVTITLDPKRVKLGGIAPDLDPAPLIRDPLPLITDPIPHNWDPAPFCRDPPLCWVESKHQTLFKLHKSQTECLECSKIPGRRSGTTPLLSALRARASAFQALHLTVKLKVKFQLIMIKWLKLLLVFCV